MPTRGRDDTTTSFVAPESPIQQEVSAIWSEVLQINAIGIHGSSFLLGGE